MINGRHEQIDRFPTNKGDFMISWICLRCDRMRSTVFCPDCGERRPSEGTMKFDISLLIKALTEFRRREKAIHNSRKTVHEKYGFVTEEKGAEDINKKIGDALARAIGFFIAAEANGDLK